MDIYFAADESQRKVAHLMSKSGAWFKSVNSSNYLEKLTRSYNAYHGNYYNSDHSLGYGGEQGELVNLAVNHYRNIAQHMLVMVTSTRPAFQARAVNTDRKSLIQTKLANNLLDYYMREKRLEKYLKKAVEYAIVLGSGYVKMEWNSTRGEIHDYVEPDPSSIVGYDEEGNPLDEAGNKLEAFPIHEGDVEFNVLSPLDVVFDSTKENPELHDWVLCRTFLNKFDLAKKYPEFADKILSVPTKDKEQGSYKTTLTPYDETVDVAVYEFFHKRTESMPEGNYCLFLHDDCVLIDTIMPYGQLPIYRIAPSDILGTPYGYSMMFDLLPLQDTVNSLYSTIMTNQNAFGVQSILNPRGNDVKVTQLQGGLNFIEYNNQVGAPTPLNLTATPGEIFNFLQKVESTMETISGVNSVARGNPEASLRSGNALALVQSQALQFISGLQQSYIQLLEDVGTGLVKLLQDFAKVPRIIAIAGVSQTTKMEKFKSDDISSISRVVVDVGNALMSCLAEGTEVMMYDGTFKKVEDIYEGNLVMGWDSKPKTVTVAGTGFQQMYEVHDRNGNFIYKCNENHIMTLKYCSSDSRYGVKKGQIIDISVKDYLKLPERHQRILMGFKVPINFDHKFVTLDPYILGSWLGDGNRCEPSITTMDKEIENYWREYANHNGLALIRRKSNTSGRASTFTITSQKSHGCVLRNKVLNYFNQYNLIKNKHIPADYKYNDELTRLQILAGFLDIDGTLVDQTFVFTQKCNKVTDDICFIAGSLGFRVSRKKLKRQTEKSKQENEYNIVSIGGDTWRIPTKLPRKQSKECKKQKNWLNYGIKLTKVNKEIYYGFCLKEDPHFLLKDFTVTHNTTAGRAQIAENLMQMGLIKSPEKYLMVLNTGSLDYFMEDEVNELDTIKAENEALLKGDEVIAVITDDHASHIRQHKGVIADPILRKDPELLQRTLKHIQEHIDMLKTVDPGLLGVIQQQPLPPTQAQAPQNTQDIMNNPQAQSVAIQDQLPPVPEPSTPPAPFEDVPQTAQEAMARQLGG